MRLPGALLGLLVLAASPLQAGWGVSPAQALEEARQIVADRNGWSIYRGDGHSMAPRFDATHLLIVKEADFGNLQPGMIALFRDAEGDLVAHTVSQCDDTGFTTRGLNNRRSDPVRIPGEALLGVLIGTLAADAAIPEAYPLPTALGKTYE